jgi:hypothetical protein
MVVCKKRLKKLFFSILFVRVIFWEDLTLITIRLVFFVFFFVWAIFEKRQLFLMDVGFDPPSIKKKTNRPSK